MLIILTINTLVLYIPFSANGAINDGEALSANAIKTQDQAVAWLNAQGGATYNLDTSTPGTQCVEFVKAYVNWLINGNPWADAWGRPTLNGGDIWQNSLWSELGWQVIQNTSDFVPQPGDIFSSVGMNNNGHTGVVISSDINNAVVAESNVDDYSGSGTPVRVRNISWTGIHTPKYYIRPNFAISDATAPTISNARAENVSGSSFTIKCDLYDDVGVTRVWVVLYGPNGESQFGVPASNGAFSHTINTADYGGPGEYAYGFYAQDAAGNSTKGMVEPIYAGVRFKSADAVNLGDDFIAEISHVKSGKKISTNSNENVVLNSINGSDNQKWHFTRYSDGSYKIANCQSNKSLDVAGGRTENETNIQVYQSNESAAQKWYIIENTSGYGLVPLCCTSSALDVYGGYTADGTNVQQYQWNQGGAQNFTIDYVSLTPSATLEFNSHKYEYFNNNTTWYQAYRTCEKLGGHLVTITSSDERNKILELTNNFSGRIWVGATIDGSKSWYWINSEPYTENGFWAAGEPNNSGGKELVAEMSISGSNKGQWNDISGHGSTIEGFVCEYDEIVDANNYAPAQSVTFGGYTYDLYDNNIDRQTAKKICELKGGQLTDIANATEQEIVYSLIQKGSRTSYWIGLSDLKNEGIWQWCNGNIASYKNWSDNEPNNALGIEEYVSIYRGTGKWNDYPSYANGYTTHGFICKTKATLLPPKTIFFNSHRYEFYSNTATWIQAVKLCEQKGGHLVTITSEEENNAILQLTEGYTGSAWIGATDFNNNLKWCWVNTEPFSYSNWNKNEPNNYLEKETCAEIMMSGDSVGKWNDMPMNSYTEKGFICEYDDIVNPDNYHPAYTVEQNGYRYELYEENVDWQTAKQICEKKQGALVSIENTDENDIVMTLAKKGSNAQYWIGLTDIDDEGQWKWYNEKRSEYRNWQLGEPNNDLSAEDYATIVKSDGKWNDIPSFTYYYKLVGFICEYENTDFNLTATVDNDKSEVTVHHKFIAGATKYNLNIYNANNNELLQIGTGVPDRDVFIVLDNGDYYVSITTDNNMESEKVYFSIRKPLIGDTNLDGIVSIGDVTAIQRHLAELATFNDEQLALADTNGDGKVDISDATHLQKYLAEFDGIVLGKQT